jgi:REP element-mobilizing transposase RayT
MAESGIYHVMLRGVNRDAIFLEDEDHERFLHALTRTRELSGCIVLAYCLMTNHVHLVLRTVDEPIGEVLKRLGIRYAGYFNRKYGRAGYVFQGRFRSVPVESDAQLVALVRYVWHNPVKAGMVTRAEDYPWSSCRFFDGGSPLADAAQLRRLVPPDALSAASTGPAADGPQFESAPVGRPRRHSDEEAADLLRRACAAASPDEFAQLDPSIRRRAVCELRTRSVSYEQLARVTGMSTSSVRRLHISGRGSRPGDAHPDRAESRRNAKDER